MIQSSVMTRMRPSLPECPLVPRFNSMHAMTAAMLCTSKTILVLWNTVLRASTDFCQSAVTTTIGTSPTFHRTKDSHGTLDFIDSVVMCHGEPHDSLVAIELKVIRHPLRGKERTGTAKDVIRLAELHNLGRSQRPMDECHDRKSLMRGWNIAGDVQRG